MREKAFVCLNRLLEVDDTPERIAQAFAMGVFLAFSPLIGVSTFLGLIIAFFFGLNRIALLLGVFISNPCTLIPISAAGTYLGGLIVGFPSRPSFPSLEWQAFWHRHFWMQLIGQWHILKPMFVGSFVLSAVFSAFSYIAALYLIRQRRAHQGKC
jgi:uncharacterized protein